MTTLLDAWCYCLQKAESLNSKAMPKALNYPPFIKAMEVLEAMSNDTRQIAIIEGRLKARAIIATDLAEAREEAELIGEIRILQRTLKLPSTPRDQLKLLSAVELSQLAEELKRQAFPPSE